MANVIDGVVVTFLDVTGQKIAQEELQEALDFAEAIVETVREPLVILNGTLQVIHANDAFYKTFDVSPGMTEKRPIYELGNRPVGHTGTQGAPRKHPAGKTRRSLISWLTIELPGVGRRRMLLNARRVVRQEARAQTILLAIEDITDRKDRREE
ncbi:MAG: PAS domain-containing protein [Comamonadaceae bacterium]|nr:PAS domain-containing protein [Comamonadaceae bacterium]